MTPFEPEIVGAERAASAGFVIACEHASHHIPDEFAGLGLAPEARRAHVAWDPGAKAVAAGLAERLGAPLVAATVSRLVYDINRPPEAPDAIPETSEVFEIPGNRGLSAAQKAARAARIHAPFHAALARLLAAAPEAALVTMHSFTPVWFGKPRAVELGILHDADPRLADAVLAAAPHGIDARRNEPYGPEHGVTHTLRLHAIPEGRPNVMIEIRNDLIADEAGQRRFADLLAAALRSARLGRAA